MTFRARKASLLILKPKLDCWIKQIIKGQYEHVALFFLMNFFLKIFLFLTFNKNNEVERKVERDMYRKVLGSNPGRTSNKPIPELNKVCAQLYMLLHQRHTWT